MFYRMNPILIASAVIPAVLLMRYVYKQDKLDRESGRMLLSLVLLGALSTAFAVVVELLGELILKQFLSPESTLYIAIEYFGIVAFAEEGGKYIVLKKRTWRSGEFNCQFDGVVYAVFVSLGFALWENIKYVSVYGISTALVRAVTAIPGHACFGVFMGVLYGMAKRYDGIGQPDVSARYRKAAVFVPALIHGFYDFCLSMQSAFFSVIFLPFILLMFLLSFALVRRLSQNDRYINQRAEDIQVYIPMSQLQNDYNNFNGGFYG